ncbi:MAG: hypothetical protein ACOX2O_01410 [Bdellovibrionota bacterium]|jgi:hypothetical protein
MDVVTGLLAAKGIQEVGSYVRELLSNDSSDFNSILSGLVQPDSANNVNEEELFASLLTERIAKLKGNDAAAEYQELLETEKGLIQRADGYVSYETAAKNALSKMVASESLSKEEADQVHAEAFEGAQLDDNLEALYDGRGSENDPTIAIMSMDSALEMARLRIEAFNDGSQTADTSAHGLSNTTTTTKSSSTSNGTSMDGSGGFLWKPVSDSNGKLVVILPSDISTLIEKVVLKDANGNELEEGRASGLANPDAGGDRAHFRFSKAGGDYPNNVVVEVTLNNGEVITYTVTNTSERCD